jgi:phosphoribosylanthranilate isomerase
LEHGVSAPDGDPAGGLVIKICGLTSQRAVAAAVAAGAHRLGFVFASSPREVSPAQAAVLSADVPRDVGRVAVLRHASQAQVDRILDRFAADWVQADAASLRDIVLPPGTRALPVVRDGEAVDPHDTPVMLYEAAESGRGALADWGAAAQLASRAWLMLAGGLHSDNVAEAIRRVRPAGVDVSSGVESAPGVKDPTRIQAFVAAARGAVCGKVSEQSSDATDKE